MESTAITRHLTVDDTDSFITLFGINDENIELIKKELGISILVHGGDVTISGDAKGVETAYLTLQKLLEIIARGDTIDKTRIRYGQVVTYSTDVAGDGKSYFFGGPVLNTTTIKTGSDTKPAVKSITAKAVNVRYHAVRHYGQYTGVYLYTEKFYTCKIRVTVKLKKKPGTAGMFINGKWVKGNKKTYTKTFSPYPNYYFSHPRGSGKFTVTLRTGQSKKWGGYSPTVSRTKKLS